MIGRLIGVLAAVWSVSTWPAPISLFSLTLKSPGLAAAEKEKGSMIMSYIQPKLAGLRRVGLNLGVAIEQVHQVGSGSHPVVPLAPLRLQVLEHMSPKWL